MTNNTSSKSEIYLITFGTILIFLGLLCNEWTLSWLLCPDAVIEQRHKVSVLITEIVVIGIGLAMIIFRKKDVAVNLSILMLTLMLILAGTEAFFRVFYPQTAGVSEHQRLFEYQSELGWQLIPNKTGLYISKHEFKTRIAINSAGMRDIEYTLAKPPGKKRIAVLGDSFTSSMGVDLPEAFTEIMEAKLLRDVEVLNFGVNGYGPAQEMLILQKRAIQYQPDLVVMVIFVGNDFDDITGASDWIDGYIRPKAIADDGGQLRFTGIPVPLSEKHQSRVQAKNVCGMPRSHFIDFIDKTIRRNKHSFDSAPSEIRLCRNNMDASTKESYRLMGAIIRETNLYCKKNGASFMVAVAPSIVQVYERLYWNEIKKKYNLNDHDYDLMLPNKRIGDICKEAQIPVVDLTQGLKSAADTGKNDTYYFKNQHWNKAGEQIVADVLSRFIIENKLL